MPSCPVCAIQSLWRIREKMRISQTPTKRFIFCNCWKEPFGKLLTGSPPPAGGYPGERDKRFTRLVARLEHGTERRGDGDTSLGIEPVLVRAQELHHGPLKAFPA